MVVEAREPLPAALKALHPQAGSHFARIRGQEMHYCDVGQGPVVMMLHGNPTWSFYFRRVIARLAQSFRVIVPDHIGCGLSSVPSSSDYPFTLASRIEDLEALLVHLRLDQTPIHLIVHDWGGLIGTGLALRRPKLTPSMVITNTAAFGLPPLKSLQPGIRLAKIPLLNDLLVRHANLFLKATLRWGLRIKKLDAQVRAGYLWPYQNPKHRRAIQKFVEDIPLKPGHPSFKLLKEIENSIDLLKAIPRLVMWGERDFVFDKDFLNYWQKVWPDAEYRLFPQAGHLLFEDAFEECLPVLESFLCKV